MATVAGNSLGRFITFEGGEGVGKSTLMHALADWLKTIPCEVVVSREPGGTGIADAIRQLFKSPPAGEEILPETEALLVSAARAQHVKEMVRPSLNKGHWVLCDRYADSTRVYQGLLGGIAMNDLEWLVHFSTKGLEPHLTFLLDCEVDISLSRIQNGGGGRDDAARFDQAGKVVHERLRRGFRQVAGFYPARFYILDASKPASEIFEDAKAEICRRWF